MILLKSTDALEVLLSAAPATNQAVLYAAYADIGTDGSTFAPGNTSGLTNGTTAVSWAGSPASALRQVKYLSLFNADTASITATVRINDGTNLRTLVKFTLATGERIAYVDGHGFTTFASDGSPKGSAVTSVNGATGAVTFTYVASVNGQTGAAVIPDTWAIAVSDESTAIATGTANVTFYAPYACTIDEVFIGLSGQSSSGAVTVNVKKNGTTIFSTQPSINASADTNLTGTAAVLSATALAKGDKLTIDIVAAGTGAKGLKVYFRVHY